MAWLIWPLSGVPRQVAWVGAVHAVATWVVTMFVSVRQHDILARGFDARAHNLLVATNWLRTASGTARGAILPWVIAVMTKTRG